MTLASSQEQIYKTARESVQEWPDKVVFLRNFTTVAAESIPDGSLDFAYLDARHVLYPCVLKVQRACIVIKEKRYRSALKPSLWKRSLHQNMNRSSISSISLKGLFSHELKECPSLTGECTVWCMLTAYACTHSQVGTASFKYSDRNRLKCTDLF